MYKNILLLIFIVLNFQFCIALKAEERPEPHFSFLDGDTYTTQSTKVYDCPSKDCKIITDLPGICAIDYYAPAGLESYGDWIHIYGYYCIENNHLLSSGDKKIDGYILESDTSFGIESISLPLKSNRPYQFNLLLCKGNDNCIIWKSINKNIYYDLKNSNCSIFVDYITDFKKKPSWFLVDIENSSCIFKKYKDYTIVAAQILK